MRPFGCCVNRSMYSKNPLKCVRNYSAVMLHGLVWCFYLCREQLQLNFMHQTDHYFVRLIVVSAVVIIDLMVSLLTACVKVSLSASSHWLPATISDLRLAGIRDWPADTASDRMPTNLGAWIRPPSPRLTCLSKSPVNCNDCSADWKSPAFFLSLSAACMPLHFSCAIFSALLNCWVHYNADHFTFWFYSRVLALFSSVTLSC